MSTRPYSVLSNYYYLIIYYLKTTEEVLQRVRKISRSALFMRAGRTRKAKVASSILLLCLRAFREVVLTGSGTWSLR